MGKMDLIRDLRLKTGNLIFFDMEFWEAPHFPSKVARGIVVELLGNAKTEWLLQLFKAYPENYIFWCERTCRINPAALYQRGIQLERIQFINTQQDLKQPLRLALESQHYPFIVAPSCFHEIPVLQRLSHLAKTSKSTLFLLSEDKFSTAWPISLQLRINHSSHGFDILIQKQKHGAGE